MNRSPMRGVPKKPRLTAEQEIQRELRLLTAQYKFAGMTEEEAAERALKEISQAKLPALLIPKLANISGF